MKKLLVILLFVPCFSLFAQFNTYHPFPDSSAAWRATNWWVTVCGTSTLTLSQEYDDYLRGDTLVNGKTYFKVNSSGGFETAIGDCPPYDTTLWQCYNSLACLLRNDTLGKKVYISLPPNYSSDTLLYDFTLNVGDTLPDTYISSKSGGFYVSSIDSVLVGASYRKQLIIAYDTGILKLILDSIIEGIGSADGLLSNIFIPFEAGNNMECFSTSTFNFSYYPNAPCTMFYTCPIPTVVITVGKNLESVSVYPNPSAGKFSFEIDNYKAGSDDIQIYNALGQQVYVAPTPLPQSGGGASFACKIDLSAEPDGIYLYRVIDENGSLIGEGKVVIQK